MDQVSSADKVRDRIIEIRSEINLAWAEIDEMRRRLDNQESHLTSLSKEVDGMIPMQKPVSRKQGTKTRLSKGRNKIEGRSYPLRSRFKGMSLKQICRIILKEENQVCSVKEITELVYDRRRMTKDTLSKASRTICQILKKWEGSGGWIKVARGRYKKSD